MTERGANLTRLVDSAMVVQGPGTRRFALPRVEWPLWCHPAADSKLDSELRRELIDTYYSLLEEERAAWALRRGQALSTSPAALVCLADVVQKGDSGGVEDEILAMAERLYPGDAHVRLAVVERDARAGHWTGDALLVDAADEAIREHLIHLHGLVLLRRGLPQDALGVWRAASSCEHCPIDGLVELAQALLSAQAEEPMAGQDGVSCLAGLVRAVVQADTCVVRGDLAAARGTLDLAWIRSLREEQTSARLAELYLDAPPGKDPIARFRTATALAGFLEASESSMRDGHRLWLCERTWDKTRIRVLVERASAWLEGELFGSWPP
jgi:hypothetical protein